MSIFDFISNALGTQSPAIQSPAPLSGFSIDEFKINALQNGVAKTNLYLVNFQQSPIPNSLMFFTDGVNLPAIDMDTQQIRRYGYGPIENVAFRPIFPPFDISFIVESSNQNAVSAIMKALSSISPFMGYNDMSSQGAGVFGTSNQSTPYEVAYKKDYEFDLQVYVFNEIQNTILGYNFRECFARQISGIQLNWNNTDNYMKVDVTFVYTDLSLTTVDSSSVENLPNINNIQNALGFSSLSQTFDALSRPQNVIDAINVNNAGSFL